MSLTIGSLFAGYGGLDLGLSSVIDCEPAWFAEFDKAPSAILAHHWPDVPNLGDVTKVDWAGVEPVDIITGGSPCQDLSHAGKRKGMTDGTRSNLWAEMREAVAVIRPRLVVWENVRGALSAHADSDLEPCAGCVGDGRGRTVLRALGRVLGDLAELGYDAWWYGLRAADVGAPHGRFRIFLFAAPADADLSGLEGRRLRGERAGERPARPRGVAAGLGERGGEFVGDDLGAVLPLVDLDEGADVGEGFGAERDGFHDPTVAPDFPAHQASSGASLQPRDLTLLPTPAVNDMGAAYTPETWDAWTERMKAEHGNGNGHGKSLNIEALRLLPTPTTSEGNGAGDHGTGALDLRTTVAHLLPTPRATDGTKGGPNQRGSSGDLMLPSAVQNWREYEPAIRRWEVILGRPAPPPTILSKKGKPQLCPEFVTWMMGLPAGHVTDPAIGISRNDQLKALGNGVVPQQCAAAVRAFLHDLATEKGAA